MNIFELRQQLISDFSSYVNSFIEIQDSRIKAYVEQSLFRDGVLWPEPLIQLNPRFRPGNTIDEMVAEGVLHPECASIFRRGKSAEVPEGHPLQLHTHQEEAIRVAQQGYSYVLTTGTGSGKSLAYIAPIVDYVLRNPGRPGIKAIVVYPMNALANSQMEELKKYLKRGETAARHGVRFDLYTGQQREERADIIANPPDILLTNYVMLELILTRMREQRLLSSAQLRFLVLDELHTYRGRQGADVSLLVRRVRDRLTPPGETLQCVGTSATLAGDGSFDEQRRGVADMATRLFGTDVYPQHVISETLVRATKTLDEQSAQFRHQLSERVQDEERASPEAYKAFINDPLSIWLESTFGITTREGRYIRTRPRRIAGEQESAASLLAERTGVDPERCAKVIKEGLLAGNERVRDPESDSPLFAFRLHQFISKGDTIYATLNDVETRHLTLQYQRFMPGDRDRILLPLAFCRECGQEYYCVRWKDEQTLVLRELQDQISEANEQDKELKHTGIPGFLYIGKGDERLHSQAWIEEKLPGDWKEEHNGKQRVIYSARRFVPQPLRVRPDGEVVEEGDADGIDCLFIRSPFRFCLHCGVLYGPYQKKDFSKLSLLSSEGRSTATTVLSLSTIRHLREARDRGEEPVIEPKLLSFTDNRQDASLQAGHFNDFVEMGLLRSALYRAVKDAGSTGLQHDTLTLRVFDALNLALRQYSVNTEVKYSARVKTDQALRNILGYRLYLDLQRGWRITSPNLEQCGLLVIDYQDLAEVCADDELWKACAPVLKEAAPGVRGEICKTLLDFMRRELAIKAFYLDPLRQEEIKQQSNQHLIAPWAIDEDEEMVYASRLFPRKREQGDERNERYLSGRSSFGSYIRRILGRGLKPDDAQLIIEQLLKTLSHVGLVEEVVEGHEKNEKPGYQLAASGVIWREGDGISSYHDPLRMPNLPNLADRRINPFFRDFYQECADNLRSIQEIQAREHTAQVPSERREEREKEFRAGLLPILYCSPTMELGVDIAELNIVNMRNIPPTPANYAQRSGRAGRGGQPALVFSYCSTGSSHDQYFFRHPEEMVSGAVAPPRIDLTNEDLVRAHMHAIWLAETGLSLEQSLKDLLDVSGDAPALTLLDHVRQRINDEPARRRAEGRARAVLNTLNLDPEKASWYADNWLTDTVLTHVSDGFDQACERWRDLYRAAQDQRDKQNAVIRDASRTPEDKKQATRLRAEAESQLDLLTTVDRLEQSEFYSYRYFASEGFLPGYNFPRLPLSAYVPGRRTKQRDNEYLSRPRFLAISEFAPRAIIYHEGSRYIINRSILSARDDISDIATITAKQCTSCGYFHPVGKGESLDICVHCRQPLTQQIGSLFKLQNVSTRRKDKINSDEEERQRQGYEIRTGLRFAERNQRPVRFIATVLVDGEPVARLTYGQAATLWRINLGQSRRKDKKTYGFVLDTERGYWDKDDETAGDPNDPVSPRKRRVVPYVEDTRNCLLFEPQGLQLSRGLKEMASLQAAIKSAIQIHYQLEDNELAAEPLPDTQNRRALLFYEAAEGGAGVLRQLIDDSTALAAIAREALLLCHYNPRTFEDLKKAERALEACEAACYNCLLTYANQRDHANMDRSTIKDFLVLLTGCEVQFQFDTGGQELGGQSLSLFDEPVTIFPHLGENELEREWLNLLRERGCRVPDEAHSTLKGAAPDFLYREDQVVIYIDGAEDKAPGRHNRDRALEEDLIDEGYIVLRFGRREQWEELFAAYPKLFGRNA